MTQGGAMQTGDRFHKRVISAFVFFCILIFSGVAHAQIVAFGSGNTSGAGLAPAQAYPAQLEAKLKAKGYDVQILNAGVYGDTTTGMLNRFESAIPAGTRIVILDTAGGFFNNNLRGISRTQGQADVAAIMSKLKARGIRVISMSPAGLQPGLDRIHLTPEGQAAVADRLLPQVVSALRSKR